MKKINKKAFSFVELIVVLAVLIILAVIGINMLNDNKQKVNNTKIEAGIKTISNSLFAYLEENKSLPNPGGNNNYFKADSGYAHDENTAFGVYGSITEKTLPKKYLDTLPLDPVSNHYYSYGKTLDNKYFEVASVVRTDDEAETKLDGTYPGEFGPISLIREYNGPFFVSDKNKKHLPYNPDEHIITAKIGDIVGTVSVNKLDLAPSSEKQLKQGDKIKSGSGSSANIYFSDGSVSVIGSNSDLTLSEMAYNNAEHNLSTKIKLFLTTGEIFTKATNLDSTSAFEIYTADTTAAVRGTIFHVKSNPSNTIVSVIKGVVAVYKQDNILDETLEITGDELKVNTGENTNDSTSTGSLEQSEIDTIENAFEIDIIEDNLPNYSGRNVDEILEIVEEGSKKDCYIGGSKGKEDKDGYCELKDKNNLVGTTLDNIDLGENFEIKLPITNIKSEGSQYLLDFGSGSYNILYNSGSIYSYYSGKQAEININDINDINDISNYIKFKVTKDETELSIYSNTGAVIRSSTGSIISNADTSKIYIGDKHSDGNHSWKEGIKKIQIKKIINKASKK